jgi:hypothetical protein
MATPVRPHTWPTAPANTPAVRNDAKVAAQKAFFEAALAGKVSPGVAQAAQGAPSQGSREAPRPTATAAQAVRSVAAVEARAADRLPPPGSLVNILV